MSEERLPRAVWSGTVRVGSLELECHVLEDGRRIIEAASLERFFAALEENETHISPGDFDEFAAWYVGKEKKR